MDSPRVKQNAQLDILLLCDFGSTGGYIDLLLSAQSPQQLFDDLYKKLLSLSHRFFLSDILVGYKCLLVKKEWAIM